MNKFEKFLFMRIDTPVTVAVRFVTRPFSRVWSWYTRWIRIALLRQDEFDINRDNNYQSVNDEYLSRLGLDVNKINKDYWGTHGHN